MGRCLRCLTKRSRAAAAALALFLPVFAQISAPRQWAARARRRPSARLRAKLVARNRVKLLLSLRDCVDQSSRGCWKWLECEAAGSVACVCVCVSRQLIRLTLANCAQADLHPTRFVSLPLAGTQIWRPQQQQQQQWRQFPEIHERIRRRSRTEENPFASRRSAPTLELGERLPAAVAIVVDILVDVGVVGGGG